MLQMMKSGFAVLVAVASIAQSQPRQSTNQAVVTEAGERRGDPSWDPTWYADAQYLNDLYRQQQSYWVLQGKADQGSGLSLTPVDDAARVQLKLPKGQGLIATSVSPGGPAAHAGVCQNDILLTLGDAVLGKPEDLEEHLKAAGDKPLGLVLLHHGEKKTLQVQPQINVTLGPVQPAPPEFWIGVSVSPVEPALRAHLKIPADQGLIAIDVIAESPAAKSGLKVHDILLTMAGQPLRDQASLVDLVQKNGEKNVAVEIVRDGSRQTFQVTPQRRKNPHVTPARVHLWDFNVVRPGAVLQGKDSPVLFYTKPEDTLLLGNYYADLAKTNPNSTKANPIPDRLDAMAAEIKELRKVVEELGKALKDRK
jgi:membrane-associated protease RseP (regulator of RpoE activity)